jgi:hypothetical protein
MNMKQAKPHLLGMRMTNYWRIFRRKGGGPVHQGGTAARCVNDWLVPVGDTANAK